MDPDRMIKADRDPEGSPAMQLATPAGVRGRNQLPGSRARIWVPADARGPRASACPFLRDCRSSISQVMPPKSEQHQPAMKGKQNEPRRTSAAVLKPEVSLKGEALLIRTVLGRLGAAGGAE
eukprot:2683437-Prymnesium_polylepis.1